MQQINTAMTVTAQINIDTPIGRKILRELEKHPKIVKVDYPLPEAIAGQATYTAEEVFDECLDNLSNHYQTDCKKIWRGLK